MKGHLAEASVQRVPETEATPREGDLRVWWIPQIPGKSFYVPVESAAEARKVMDILGRYDAFQFENRIKPDYSNAGGLIRLEDGEWLDWEDDNGNGIDDEDADLTSGQGTPPENVETK